MRYLRSSCFFAAAPLLLACVATATLQTTTNTTPPAPTEQWCSTIGGSGVDCPVGEECCGIGTMAANCYDNTTTECCVYYLDSTLCAAGQTCCGSGGPGASSVAFCCPVETQCCGGTCCPLGQSCCDGECCIPPPPPSGAPGHPGNWSIEWELSGPGVGRIMRTDLGLLSYGAVVSLFDPKTGLPIWNITRGFYGNQSVHSGAPIALTSNVFYIAGHGVNLTNGQILWSQDATGSPCASTQGAASVFPNKASSFIVACSSPDATHLIISGVSTATGAILFTNTINVADAATYGVKTVARHVVVALIASTFMVFDAQSGASLWNTTVPGTPTVLPAQDVVLYTIGTDVFARHLESGKVLWSAVNFISPSYQCQSVVRLRNATTVTSGTEVAVWPLRNGTLALTETRTGKTRLTTNAWTSTINPNDACVFANNLNFFWSVSGPHVTAIALVGPEPKVAWTIPLPGIQKIHVASPNNSGPYVRAAQAAFLRLSAEDGNIAHSFSIFPPSFLDPLHVAQFEYDRVVAMGQENKCVGFKLP